MHAFSDRGKARKKKNKNYILKHKYYQSMKKLIIYFLILMSSSNSFAQTFTNYSKVDGLGADCINAISQDLLGNLWFGTTNGVTKFDGITWTNYTNENGLVDNLIYSRLIL